MKLLLIVPNTLGKYFKPGTPHVGVAYLSAVAEEKGHQVEVVDMRVHPRFENLSERVTTFKPDLMGVTTTSLQSAVAFNLVDTLKRRFSIPVVIGASTSAVNTPLPLSITSPTEPSPLLVIVTIAPCVTVSPELLRGITVISAVPPVDTDVGSTYATVKSGWAI